MQSVIRLRNVVFATLLLSLFIFASQSAQAATLTISTTADAGNGSLRQALLDATNNQEANTVAFDIPLTDPGYNATTNRYTITLVNPLPNVPLAPFTMDNSTGRGLTITGNNSFRIFTLVNSAVVHLTNMTISQGSSNGGLGGGIYMSDSAVLFLNNCIVTGNSATNGGGGIWVNDSGVLHVVDSTISNNSTTTNGGGIYVSISGTLNITSSTVSGNTATVGGAGIFNGVSGTVNATNVTLSGNTAGDLGGGLLNNATATINSTTISGNSATNGGGGIFNNFTAVLNNSLIALNTGADGADLLGRGSRGKPFSGNANLIGNADGSEAFGPTTNQLGTTANPINPRLGPLRDNGGPTFTQALLACSPAIDSGTTALATDGRGLVRPQDGDGFAGAQADVGAFEQQTALVCDTTPSAGEVLITEFRTHGPNGPNDEFVELYNNTDEAFKVVTLDSSSGWSLVSSDGVVRATVPNNTVIPARAHYLIVNNASQVIDRAPITKKKGMTIPTRPLGFIGISYSLTAAASADLSYTSDIPDNNGLALFKTADTANFTQANVLDAVGFTGNAALYFEATALNPFAATAEEFSFVRKLDNLTDRPQNTFNNAADFTLVSTTGDMGGTPVALGAPGPENLASPITRTHGQFPGSLVDPSQCQGCGVNRVRDASPATFGSVSFPSGTLSVRRSFTNLTGAPVTRLRFRVVDFTTLNNDGGLTAPVADLRAISSSDTTATVMGSPVTVYGTTLEETSNQSTCAGCGGGGINSSLAAGVINTATPLANGDSIALQFVLGVKAGGKFRFLVSIEAAQ
jgi:hypothetical protein